MDISDILKNIISADSELSSLDISEGSVYYDLFLKPIGILYEEYLSEIVQKSSSYSYEDVKSMSLDKLKSIASMYGIYPFESKSYVYADLVFADDSFHTITEGTVFRSKSSEWKLVNSLTVSPASLESAQGRYYVGGVLLSNDEGVSIQANQINSMDNPPSSLIKISHSPSFGGGQSLSKTELDTMIKGAVFKDLKYHLGRKFPSIKTAIVGSNDPLMTRDILYTVQPYGWNYQKESCFTGKIRGDSYSNPNVCYSYAIEDKEHDFVPNSSYEISQQEYLLLMNPLNTPVVVSTKNILNEDFDSYGERIGVRSNITGLIGNDVYVENPRAFSIGDYVRFVKNGALLKMSSIDKVNVTNCVCTSEIVNGKQFVAVDKGFSQLFAQGRIAYLRTSGNNEHVVEVSSVVATDTKIMVSFSGSEIYESPVNIQVISLSVYNIPSESVNLSLELIDAEGLNIGGGWVKSEGGMSIGVCRNDREVMVVKGRLVLGYQSSDADGNIARSFINKIGQKRFVEAVLKAMKLVQGYEEVPVDTGEHNESK